MFCTHKVSVQFRLPPQQLYVDIADLFIKLFKIKILYNLLKKVIYRLALNFLETEFFNLES